MSDNMGGKMPVPAEKNVNRPGHGSDTPAPGCGNGNQTTASGATGEKNVTRSDLNRGC